MENFPQEILIEILIRLPVKSLGQFTLVSKSWYSLITSPRFISTHLTKIQNQSNKDHSLLLLRHYSEIDKREHYSLHLDEDDYDFVLKSSEIKFPLKSRVGFYRIVGSCNGLVCFCDDLFGTFRTKPIILWNPSIQKSLELPLPFNEPLSRRFLLGFGFDFDFVRCDYKVVRIVYCDSKGLNLDLPAVPEVYSLSTKSWRRVVPNGPKYHRPVPSSSQVFVNGVVHWLAYGESFGNLMMGFDMKDEVFTEVVLPEALAGCHAANLYPIVYGGCLAVVKYNWYKGYCCLWVMKEYGNVKSWKRLLKIELTEGMGKVIGFRKNGLFFATMSVDELFVNDPASGVLVSFDPENRLVKDLEIFGKMDSIYVEEFVESLVLLEGQGGEWTDDCTC